MMNNPPDEIKETISAQEARESSEERPWFNSSTRSFLQVVIALVPIFGAFLYYVGRRHTEAYYFALGIPPSGLDFSTSDYIYQGFRSWFFILAAGLSMLALRLWNIYLMKVEVDTQEGKSRKWTEISWFLKQLVWHKRGRPNLFGLVYLYYMAFVGTATLSLVTFFGSVNLAASTIIGLVLILGTSSFAVPLLFDKPTITYVKSRRAFYSLFMASIAIFVILTIQLLPKSWGAYLAVKAVNNCDADFPSVHISISSPLDHLDLAWLEQSDGTYVNQEPIWMLLQTKERIYLRQRGIDSETISISVMNVSNIRVVSPLRIPQTGPRYF